MWVVSSWCNPFRNNGVFWGRDIIRLGNKGVLCGRDVMSLGNNFVIWGRDVIHLGNKGVFWGRGVVILGNKGVFWGRDVVILGNKGVFRGRDVVILGNKGVFWGRGQSDWNRNNHLRSQGRITAVKPEWPDGYCLLSCGSAVCIGYPCLGPAKCHQFQTYLCSTQGTSWGAGSAGVKS